MKLVIGNKNYSSWSLRPWLLMQVRGIPFEEERVALYTGDYKARLAAFAPSGKVPVLIDDGVTVWDSLAIIEYLADKFPDLPIWPDARAARAQARSIVAEMHSGFAALRTHMPMNLRARHPGVGQSPEVLADIDRVKAIWTQCRERHAHDGDFLFGSFSAADAFYAPVATRMTTYGVALPELCQRYVDTLQALPAMQQWTAAGLAEVERIAAAEPYGDGARP